MKLLVQKGYGQSCGYKSFLNDARNIERFIETKKNKMGALNIKGASSQKVQQFLYGGIIKKLGYKSEKKQDYFVPDFIKLSNKLGIIIEVERGKTVNNNMDFIDFWKCHIHPKCNMLIIIVPNTVPRSQNKTVKVYPFVVRRMAPLFEKKNYTNVKALAIIPY